MGEAGSCYTRRRFAESIFGEGERQAMRVGLFTTLYAKQSLDDVIQRAKKLGISDLGVGTGNYPGDAHCKLEYLTDTLKRTASQKKLPNNGMRVSAFPCTGNPLHPNMGLA